MRPFSSFIVYQVKTNYYLPSIRKNAMNALKNDEIRKAVQENYGKIAETGSEASCGCNLSSCCDSPSISPEDISKDLGYSQEDLIAMPSGANMGLGCGNPQAIASLKHGETVLDLGSGGGFDCFLAAKAVGEKGHVIGVDMTPEMIRKARKNATKINCNNVEFRLGEIEHLPVADETIDVILSNCVINLSPEKEKVFKDAFRVLKKGGRLAISDVVATAEMPEEIKTNIALHSSCIAGASTIQDLKTILAQVGFKEIQIQAKDESREFIKNWVPNSKLEEYILSATIEAVK